MKDYKEKLEGFIDDLNSLISDSMINPMYSGGKYEVRLYQDNTGATCELSFSEKNDSLVFIRLSTNYIEDKDFFDFYHKCYLVVFRTIMYGLDVSFGSMIDPVQNTYIHYLSFSTLSQEGLKKYREWKKQTKPCFSCKNLNNSNAEKCGFCGEEL